MDVQPIQSTTEAAPANTADTYQSTVGNTNNNSTTPAAPAPRRFRITRQLITTAPQQTQANQGVIQSERQLPPNTPTANRPLTPSVNQQLQTQAAYIQQLHQSGLHKQASLLYMSIIYSIGTMPAYQKRRPKYRKIRRQAFKDYYLNPVEPITEVTPINPLKAHHINTII